MSAHQEDPHRTASVSPPQGGAPTRATVVKSTPPQHLMGDTTASPDSGRVSPVPGVVGRFQLGKELARGGMGVVYRAHEPVIGREVAVKLIKEEFRSDPRAVARFLAEARITGQLQHPGIPPVFDVGELPDGSPYLAMKLIEGQTLEELLRQRPNPTHDRGRFVAVFEQICQAVGYAHARKVIHRDLKPSNVMVGAFGEVQVMDWGLAKVLERESRATVGGEGHLEAAEASDPDQTTDQTGGSTDESTRPGQALGTPAYMPPEQARGELARIDRRSDVFALGGILCTILTGKPPYAGHSGREAMRKAATGELGEALSRLDANGAGSELIDLCKRFLSLDRGNRPADAREVAALVAAHRAGVEERLRAAERERAKAEARVVEQRKRRRVQAWLACAVLLLVTGGGAFAWWQDKQATARREQLARNTDALGHQVGRCEEALEKNDADRAAAALGEIDRRLPEGGGDELRDRIERCRADLPVLQELDAADLFRLTPVQGRLPDHKAVAARWRAAMAGYGVVPGVPAEELNRRLDGSLVLDRLLTTLDLILAFDPSPTELAVLRAADPHRYRDAVRALVSLGRAGDNLLRGLALQPEALAQPPRFTAVLGQLGALPINLRRTVLETALSHHPDALPLLLAMGETYLIDRRGLEDERMRWLQAAVAAHPRMVLPHSNLGDALFRKGDWGGAIAAYQKVTELDRTFFPGWHGLGGAREHKGDLDGAVEAYRKAIHLNPGSAGTHCDLGSALKAKGDLDGAVASYMEATRLDPSLGSAFFNLGRTLLEMGELNGSIAYYTAAVHLMPDFPLCHCGLGEALEASGDHRGAAAAYKAAREVSDPQQSHNHFTAGVRCRDRGDADGAIMAFNEAIRLNPLDPWAHANIGVIYHFIKKDLDKALTLQRKAVRLGPTHAILHWELGHTLLDKGDTEGAIALFAKAIQLDPKATTPHCLLGNALEAKGGLDGAVAEYETAVRLNAADPNARQNLDLALKRKAERDARAGGPQDPKGKRP